MYAAVFRARKQTGSFQYSQVFGNRRQRHVERLGQFSHAANAVGEASEDGAAGRIGQRGKREVERCVIFNHMVNNMRVGRWCQGRKLERCPA
jgi:hypothetical protein